MHLFQVKIESVLYSVKALEHQSAIDLRRGSLLHADRPGGGGNVEQHNNSLRRCTIDVPNGGGSNFATLNGAIAPVGRGKPPKKDRRDIIRIPRLRMHELSKNSTTSTIITMAAV